LFLPFSWLYGGIMYIRNMLYDTNLFKVHSFDIHTIGIGNLSMGGDGKTPMAEYLIELCKSQGIQPSVLSRGYKRNSKGFVFATSQHGSAELGDEPYLFFTKYKVPVAVDENRVRGIRKMQAQKDFNAQVIVLDDVYQHRSVKAGLTILVSDFKRPFFNDFVLPSGRLREFPKACERADIVVFTKTPEHITAMEMKSMLKDFKIYPHQHVYFSFTKYGELYHINDAQQTLNTLKELCHLKVILFCGIANPEPMITYLSEYALSVHPVTYPDHHRYTTQDITQLQTYFEAFTTPQKILVTTEKDLMRLKDPHVWALAKDLPIYVLPLHFTFKDKQSEFDALILHYVRRTKPYAGVFKN